MLTENDSNQLKEALKAIFPLAHCYLSTLGGIERASILVTTCFDPKETWSNGILENSKYAKFHVTTDSIEMISGYKVTKFRKCKYNSILTTINKFKEWRDKNA